MRDQPERLQRKREDARRVMGKMDRLYNSIRNLGIHYKLEENFGSTTITIGRNHHKLSGLYEDLRGGNLSDLHPQPANIFAQSQAGHDSCKRALADMTARLKAANDETAGLCDTFAKVTAEYSSEKAGLKEALKEVTIERDKMQALWNYLNLSQGDTGTASSLSLEEIIASHADLQVEVTSLKETISRIRSEASQTVLELRKCFSEKQSEVAHVRDILNKSDSEKAELTAALNHLQLSLQQCEEEKAFLLDTNASLQYLVENREAEMKKKEENAMDFSTVHTLWSSSDDDQPPVSFKDSQYKNTKRLNKKLQKMIDDLENNIKEMAEKQEETESNLRELLKNEDTALRSKRLRELEAFKSLYREEESGREFDKREAKDTIKKIQEKLRKTEKLLKESEERTLEALKSNLSLEASLNQCVKDKQDFPDVTTACDDHQSQAHEASPAARHERSNNSEQKAPDNCDPVKTEGESVNTHDFIDVTPACDEGNQFEAHKLTSPVRQKPHTAAAGVSSLLPAMISTDRTIAHRGLLLGCHKVWDPNDFSSDSEDSQAPQDTEEIAPVTTNGELQPVALEQFTQFREHSRSRGTNYNNDGSYYNEAYPLPKEIPSNAASELATSLKEAQKQVMKDRIIQAAKSLNPENPTEEQKFRRRQLLALCEDMIEEDEDALYLGTSYSAELLTDTYLKELLDIICKAEYSLGGGIGNQPPHFLGPDGDFLMCFTSES